MKVPGIYKITIGRWFYWGSTNNLHKRKAEHLSALKRSKHINNILQNAYNKHKSFEFEIIATLQKEELIEWEQELIDVWFGSENCANLSPIAQVPPSWKGRKHSEQSKERMRKPKSEEHKARISAVQLGQKRKPLTEEHKAKVSASKKGKSKSEETKARMSAAQKLRYETKKENV